MTITQTGRRVALVGLLALIGALLPFTGASAIDGDEALELSGDSNTAVSIANSEVVYTPLGEDGPDNPPTNVLIGREDVFADNLASGSLQGAAAEGDNGAPLLLTGSDELDADVQAEIERLGATSVTILGGTAAISEDVETALGEIEGVDSVERLEGATRTETAIAVAGASGADTALLVRSGAAGDDATQAFADSLGAGALAATNGYSILFTQTEVLTGSTAEFLASDDAPSSVIIVGGTAAISEDTEAEVVEILGEDAVSRVSGPTRFDTAVALNGLREGDLGSYAVAVDGQGDDAWADGFSMANLSGLNNAPLVLTNQGEVPEATETYLESINDNDARAHLTNVFVVCGSTAAGDACDALAEAFGLTVVEWPPVAPPVEENSGVLTAIDTGANTYNYTNATPESVTQAYSETNDDFTVDGTASTPGVFEANATPGDMVTVTDNGDGTFTHALTNVDTSDLLSGTVGNVDYTANTFDIIEPVSGVVLRAGLDYGAANVINTVDGSASTVSNLELNLNEGDTIEIEEGDSTDTFNFENMDVTGTVAVAVSAAGIVRVTVGNLGDDMNNAQDAYFEFAVTASPETETYLVDGSEVDFYDGGDGFADQVSSGDSATYSFVGGEETISITNAAPPLVEGVLTNTGTAGFVPAGNQITLLEADGSVTTITYTDAAGAIIYDGLLTAEAAFEAAWTTAKSTDDTVAYQAGDAATGTSASLVVNNEDVTGWVDDFTTGTPTIDLRETADGGGLLAQDVPLDDLSSAAGAYQGVYPADQAAVRYFDATGDTTSELSLQEAEDLLDERDDDELSTYVVITEAALSTNVTFYSEVPA